MKVYINNELHEGIRTLDMLKGVFEDLQIECKKENKVLQIQIDEKFVDQIPFGITEENINQINILIKSPMEVIIEGLIEGVDYIPVLCQGLRQSAQMLQETNLGEGIKLFQESIDGLSWVTQVLSGADIYLFKNDELNFYGTIYQEAIGRFSEIVNELMIAWKNEDYILISDLLEYELIPVVEEWHQYFMQILDNLAEV